MFRLTNLSGGMIPMKLLLIPEDLFKKYFLQNGMNEMEFWNKTHIFNDTEQVIMS